MLNKFRFVSLAFALFGMPTLLHAVPLALTSPLDFQVVQRESKSRGRIHIAGKFAHDDEKSVSLEARLLIDGKANEWQKLPAKWVMGAFETSLEAAAGGWYRLELRLTANDKIIAETAVEHVGIGEVFVVAGQSNSANHGEEKQNPKIDKVVTFDGKKWRIAKDPQPGASGGGGSFLPPLGDAIAIKFNVPVGFVSLGVGATSVREWLPKGTIIANPPTITSQVQKTGSGKWECKGFIYHNFVNRMKQLRPQGFRAVLWHQGESDANQKDPMNTLPGKLYRENLEKLIKDTRRDIGWEAPWFVAQVSYHVPSDESSPDIRDAQASLWKDGIAIEGPDSDAIKGTFRERNGKGVHFSGPGLRKHAEAWTEKVTPWLEKQLK